MSLIDSHCHLDKFYRHGDLDAVLERAAAAGVEQVITIGTSTEDWSLYAELAEKYPGKVVYTVGLHPCSVDENWKSEVAALDAYWERTLPPKAMGEIGLDHFHLPKDPEQAERLKAMQVEAFRAQLAIAARRNAPVVIHSRNAFAESVRLIDESGYPWEKVVFHCFSEGPESMRILNERGGRGSFTGIVTYKSAESVREALRVQGIERVMVETDAPYLAPVPHRGKPCEPAYVRYTAECCAEILGVSFDYFSQVSAENTRTFFD